MIQFEFNEYQLSTAKDFAVIPTEAYNDMPRIPKGNIFAFGVTWTPRFLWINKGYGVGTHKYKPNGTPDFPKGWFKILEDCGNYNLISLFWDNQLIRQYMTDGKWSYDTSKILQTCPENYTQAQEIVLNHRIAR